MNGPLLAKCAPPDGNVDLLHRLLLVRVLRCCILPLTAVVRSALVVRLPGFENSWFKQRPNILMVTAAAQFLI